MGESTVLNTSYNYVTSYRNKDNNYYEYFPHIILFYYDFFCVYIYTENMENIFFLFYILSCNKRHVNFIS